MSAPLGHLRILASAGSGKTFRLSGRMIDLFRRGNDPATVLASTFTRAAAAEIRDRVLRRLADAALSAKARTEFSIGSRLPPPDEDEAVALLERVARDPDRLQIRTLDSFFAAAVMAFGPELGLPASIEVVDPKEEEALRDDAVAQLLAGDSADAVVATLHALTRGHPKARVASELARAVAHAASFGRDAIDGAWRWPERNLPTKLRADALRLSLDRATAGGATSMEKAIATDRSALRDASFDDLDAWGTVLAKGIGLKVVAGDAKFNRVDIPADLYTLYGDLVAYAYDVAYAEYARRTAATGELVDSFNAAFAALKRERGLVTFEDLVFAIANSATRPDDQELFFRLDNRISHLLLDEFQDTSAVQWRAIRPIVDEITSGDAAERSFFVVGDLKQSIYGWRGALPEILGQLPSLVHEHGGAIAIEDETIAVSYRSSPIVLQAVDDVFLPLANNPAVPADEAVRSAVESWIGYCEPHVAAQQALTGRVELHLAEKVGKSNSRDQSSVTLEEAAVIVARLHRDFPLVSIGVLARRNAPVSQLLNLLREIKVPASARGVGSLLDAAPVNALIDALIFADHPDDTIASFHLAHSPLGAVLDIGNDDHRRERSGARRERSRALRETLARHGFAETLRRWADAIAGAVDAREADRIASLIELASAYDRPDAPLRPSKVAWALRATDLDQPGAGSVSIMTIHQAKGLEFDAVVLCDIDQPFAVKPALAAQRQGTVGPYERLLRWPPEMLRSADPAWLSLAAATRTGHYCEFLSLMYVALTRAKQALIAVAAPPSLEKDGTPKFATSFGNLLRGAWAPNATESGCAYEIGDAKALAARLADVDVSSAAQDLVSAPPVKLRAASGLRAMRATSASKHVESASGRFVEVLDEAREAAKALGTAMHAMFERVSWIEDGLPSETDLVAAGARALPRADRAWLRDRARAVVAALARPKIAALFARPSIPVELLREWRYARVDREGRIESGTLDRVVIERSGDRVIAVRIIDFKTESVAAEDGTARAEQFCGQMDAYRTAVSERFHADRNDVRATIAFVESDAVVDLVR